MRILLTIMFFGFSAVSFSQKVTFNHIVDATNADVKAVMTLFENYITSNPESKGKNPFWNSKEQELYENFDFLESEFQPSLYMGIPAHVLSIKSYKDAYVIKVQFSYCQENGLPYVLAIVNYLARKENGQYKLHNWLSESKHFWNCTTVGMIDFYYPSYHEFSYNKAHHLNGFVKDMCQNLGVTPKSFEYYLADDYDEIQRLKGIDYYIGMGGGDSPRGKAAERKVYCGGLGEYYKHEVFHVQIDDHFPDKHFWVSEGVATFLGGSRGRSLDWHIKRMNNYLQKHPEVDLNEMLQLTNLDNQTAYHYVIGGLIVRKIFEKGGWKLIQEFMSSGRSDESYYRAIEKFLGVPRSELNTYLRRELDRDNARH